MALTPLGIWGSRVTLAASLGLAASLRLRLLGVPLERDEGEYAYMGQLILDGAVPYVAAHNMKLPGVYYAYAGILGLLGETDVAIRLGLLALNLLTITLLYLLGRTLIDRIAGAGAAAAYAVLSLGTPVAGFAANAEHFVVAPMVAGVLLLVYGSTRDRARPLFHVTCAGLALGLAVVMKQHGAAFVAFGMCYLLFGVPGHEASWPRRMRSCLAFVVAAFVPFGIVCLGMYGADAFEPFWFWTVTYAREYAAMIPGETSLRWLRDEGMRIVAAAGMLWLLAAVGLSTPLWDAPGRRHARFLWLFVAGSALSVALGLRFTDHYFILVLPAASVAVGMAASAIARVGAARAPAFAPLLGLGVVLAAAAASVAHEQPRLALSPTALSRAVNGSNPFPEAVEIARYLEAHTAPDDRIAVIGSEPEIYFYARRRAATSFIYMYPLMERHPFAERMQEDMIAQLERELPPYMVLVNVPTSWSRRPHSSPRLLEWAARVVNEHYEQVGLAEIAPGQPTRYTWDDAARGRQPGSPLYVATFRKRS